MFSTTCSNLIAIGWIMCAPGRATPVTPASTIFKFLNFQNHREHVYNNFWKFHRNRMNGACSCRESATPGTPASTIFKFFKFPKPPQECLQQLVKVSPQSDERCVLLYGTQTLIFIYMGVGHKSWQLFYFVDIFERITNVYVSCGMSAGIVSMQNNRWLCDSWL